MLRRVTLVRTDVSKELAVLNSPILVTLMKEALCSSETSVLRSAIRRNIPEDAILQRFGNWLCCRPQVGRDILCCVP
jgi:hypothetical protein